MLQNLSQQVRECLQHAEDCAHRAKVEPDPNPQRDYLMMERRWLSLARSYQFKDQELGAACRALPQAPD